MSTYLNINSIHDSSITKDKLDTSLQNSLNLADSAEQKENKKNSLSDNSDTYYPSQKAVKTVTDALDTRITNLSTIGRFLSIWNAVTGLPITNPTESPYAYKKGDYYIVGVGMISGKKVTIDGVVYYPSTVVTGSAKNMRRYVSRTGTGYFCNKDVTLTTSTPFYTTPDTSGTAVYPSAVADTGYDALVPYGTSYTSGVASTATAEPPINVNDMYVYDGQGSWIRIDNGAKAISWGSIEGTLSNQTDLQNALTALDKVFIATYDETSYADVLAAYNAGKVIIAKYETGGYWSLLGFSSSIFTFISINGEYSMYVTLDADGWNYDQTILENTDNRQTTITDSDSYYPTSGAVVDYVANKLNNIIEKTYSELATLKSNSQLVPGQKYRMTDFVTVTGNNLEGCTSAGHPFDLILTATSTNNFDIHVQALQHSGDTYFSGSRIDLWDLRYCFENLNSVYMWASGSGKGVITYMRDEFDNEAYYDFKNILIYRKYNSSTGLWSDIPSSTSESGILTVYTFSNELTSSSTQSDVVDLSLTIRENTNKVYNNHIGEYVGYNKYHYLPRIVTFGTNVNNNVFDKQSNRCTLGKSCVDNYFGVGSYNIVMGNSSSYNNIQQSCNNIVFGSSCVYNAINQACYDISFGSNCSKNYLYQLCTAIVLGDYNSYNIFKTENNNITLGTYCQNNTFGLGVHNIYFVTTSTGETIANYFKYNTFDKFCCYLYIYNNETASSGYQAQFFHFKSAITGSASSYCAVPIDRGLYVETTVARKTKGYLVRYCEADLIADPS